MDLIGGRRGTILFGDGWIEDRVIAFKDRGRDSWRIERRGELLGVVALRGGSFEAYRPKGEDEIRKVGVFSSLVDAGRALDRASSTS